MFSVRSLLSLPFSPTGNVILGAVCAPTVLGASFPAINVLTQRWKYRTRKPIGSPRSRKKRYYVRVPTPRMSEEMSELFWRYSHYRTEVKSLMKHFVDWKIDHYPQESIKGSSNVKDKSALAIDPDFDRILEENQEENSRVAQLRNARRAQEIAFREEQRLDQLTDFEDRQAEETEKREEQVRKKKEVVARMVTPENLDERIAHAFDNPVDYNFCIFMAGKRVYGRPDPLNRLNMAYTKSDLSDQPNLDRTERKVVHE